MDVVGLEWKTRLYLKPLKQPASIHPKTQAGQKGDWLATRNYDGVDVGSCVTRALEIGAGFRPVL